MCRDLKPSPVNLVVKPSSLVCLPSRALLVLACLLPLGLLAASGRESVSLQSLRDEMVDRDLKHFDTMSTSLIPVTDTSWLTRWTFCLSLLPSIPILFVIGALATEPAEPTLVDTPPPHRR